MNGLVLREQNSDHQISLSGPVYSNQDEFATPTGRVKQRKDRKDETTVDDFVNEKLSKQILTQARLQMQDLHRETVGEPSAKKLPKLGDNLDSDEDDDEEDEEVGTDDYEKSNVLLF